MDKTQMVKHWIRLSGADRYFPDKRKAFALGWKLLNDYFLYLESGNCPETKVELYDFTQFLDVFADLYAGPDDELYNWIVQRGHTVIDAIQYDDKDAEEIPNAHCPLCSVPLTPQNAARSRIGSIRISSVGRAWCKDCAQKVDEKKWPLPE